MNPIKALKQLDCAIKICEYQPFERKVRITFEAAKIIRQSLTQLYPDGCEICHGCMGGVKGNENVINGRVVCDYCHSAELEEEEK